MAVRLKLGKAEAEAAVDTVFEAIGESLAREESVRIAGFGTFATRSREARTGRNPGTGEAIAIPASKAPSFKAGKALRDSERRRELPAGADDDVLHRVERTPEGGVGGGKRRVRPGQYGSHRERRHGGRT